MLQELTFYLHPRLFRGRHISQTSMNQFPPCGFRHVYTKQQTTPFPDIDQTEIAQKNPLHPKLLSSPPPGCQQAHLQQLICW